MTQIIYGLAALAMLIITLYILLWFLGTIIIYFKRIFNIEYIPYKWNNIMWNGSGGLMILIFSAGVIMVCYFLGALVMYTY